MVEGTRLVDMELPASEGRVDWEYVFPIRGVYRLEVTAADGTGKEVTRVFTLRIKESRTKILYLGSFTVGLFVLGVIAGRLFTLPKHEVTSPDYSRSRGHRE